MQSFTLIRPHTLAAARQRVLVSPEQRLLRAGGVDLLDRMKEGLDAPAELVELTSLQGELGQQLRALKPDAGGWQLGALDIPGIEIVFTEVHTGANNTGAIGIGEPATIPTAAAIACALYNAIGAPVRDLPLTPDRVLAALGLIPSREG